MKQNWSKIEESKAAMRKKLAKLPYGEKLRLLDRMKERDLLIKRAKTKSPR